MKSKRTSEKIRDVGLAFLFLILCSSVALAEDEIIKKEVIFKTGASSATLQGNVKGHQSIDYLVRAGAGQYMVVNFKPSIPSAYFNVLPPGSEEAIFIGSTLGNSFKGNLPKDGVYTVRVYLMGAASKEQRSIPFSIGISVTGKPKASGSFDETAELQRNQISRHQPESRFGQHCDDCTLQSQGR
jgi:hypothetical protein